MIPRSTACLVFLVFSFFLGVEASAGTGYRIVNGVDDFLAYHRAGEDKGPDDRIALWNMMIEAPNAKFFDDAIYRRKTGGDRERYKQSCIRRFWKEVAPRIDDIARLNRDIETKINATVRKFQKILPDFQPNTDFYVTISFSFRGKAVTVDDRNVLAIGLEAFLDSDERQIQITMAHELFHLYHFQFFNAGGGLYRSLWSEGLATYASAVVIPGQRRSVYLGFPAEKMNRCHDLLPLLAGDLWRNMGQNDYRLRRIYFGAEPNDTRVPPEAGYYVGMLIVEKIASKIPLARLARLSAEQVFELVQAELKNLETRVD